jgi:hypothetical protein
MESGMGRRGAATYKVHIPDCHRKKMKSPGDIHITAFGGA